jgi:hypothetical protein
VNAPTLLKAAEAVRGWAVENGPPSCDFSILERAIAEAAERLGRELDVAEVELVCAWTVAAADAASEAAIAGALRGP